MIKKLTPVFILFCIITVVTFLFKDQLLKAGVDPWVVLGGNLIIFIATILASLLYIKALTSNKPQAVIRSIYSGFMLKFFFLLIAALSYIATAKPVNKWGIFITMGLYLVYHFISTRGLLSQKSSGTDGEGKASV